LRACAAAAAAAPFATPPRNQCQAQLPLGAACALPASNFENQCAAGGICFAPPGAVGPGTCVAIGSLPSGTLMAMISATSGQSGPQVPDGQGLLYCASGNAAPVVNASGQLVTPYAMQCVDAYDWSLVGRSCEPASGGQNAPTVYAGNGTFMSCLGLPSPAGVVYQWLPVMAYDPPTVAAAWKPLAQCAVTAKSPNGTPCSQQPLLAVLDLWGETVQMATATCLYFACFQQFTSFAVATSSHNVFIDNAMQALYPPCVYAGLEVSVNYAQTAPCQLPPAWGSTGWTCAGGLPAPTPTATPHPTVLPSQSSSPVPPSATPSVSATSSAAGNVTGSASSTPTPLPSGASHSPSPSVSASAATSWTPAPAAPGGLSNVAIGGIAAGAALLAVAGFWVVRGRRMVAAQGVGSSVNYSRLEQGGR
jgi:hypothetical protein